MSGARSNPETITARRALPAGDAEITFDEQARWLRVRRGDRVLLANFNPEKALPIPPANEMIVATHPLQDGALPPLAGALLR